MYFCWMCYSQYIPNNLLSLMSQMETNSQRQSLLSIPLNGAEQKISQRRRLKLSLNDDIFHTGWFVPTIPDYFLFEPPSKYISVSFLQMVVCFKRLIRGRILMLWSSPLHFYYFSYPLSNHS